MVAAVQDRTRRRIAWRGCRNNLIGGESGERARYSVAGHEYCALTALHPDGLVVPRDDVAIRVEANLFIADRGVAVVFTGRHFIAASVLHADGLADGLR